jgi:hypothetical protein
MKNINSRYCFCKKGSFEPKFITDSTTLDDFIKDVEQYLNYNPSGYYPYKLEIIPNKTAKEMISEDCSLMFTNILVTHVNDAGKEWTNTYFIYIIPFIEKNKGISMQWNNIKSKRLN